MNAEVAEMLGKYLLMTMIAAGLTACSTELLTTYPTSLPPNERVEVMELQVNHDIDIISKKLVPIEELSEMQYELLAYADIDAGEGIRSHLYCVINTKTTTFQDSVTAYIDLQNRFFKSDYTIESGMADQNALQNMLFRETIIRISNDGSKVVTRQNADMQSPPILRLYQDRKILHASNSGVNDYSCANQGFVRCFDNTQQYVSLIDQSVSELEMQSEHTVLGENFSSDDSVYVTLNTGGDMPTITIYRTVDSQILFNYQLNGLSDVGSDLQMIRVTGNEEEGSVLISYGICTYQLSYPTGTIEYLGDYMFNPLLSPDGKYLAYTSLYHLYSADVFANNTIVSDYLHDMRSGWYIRELSSGKLL